MNYNQKQQEIKRVKCLFSSFYPEGTLKITSQESKEYVRVKAELFLWLKKNQYEVFSEVTFKSPFKGRADLLAIHKSGVSWCFEVISSESEKSLSKKQETYPIPIIEVKCKDFNYDKFCI